MNGWLTLVSKYSPIVEPDGSTLLQQHHESWQAKEVSHHDDEPEHLVDDPAPGHRMVLTTVAVCWKILFLPSNNLPDLVRLDSLPTKIFWREACVKRGKASLHFKWVGNLLLQYFNLLPRVSSSRRLWRPPSRSFQTRANAGWSFNQMALGRFQFQVKSLIGFNFAFGMYFSEEKSLCSHLQINVGILLVRVVEQSTINQWGKNYRSKALKKTLSITESHVGIPNSIDYSKMHFTFVELKTLVIESPVKSLSLIDPQRSTTFSSPT